MPQSQGNGLTGVAVAPPFHGNLHGNKTLLHRVGPIRLRGRGCHQRVCPHHGQWCWSHPCATSYPHRTNPQQHPVGSGAHVGGGTAAGSVQGFIRGHAGLRVFVHENGEDKGTETPGLGHAGATH